MASAPGGDLTLARWAIGSGAAGLTGDGYELGGTGGLFAAGRLAGGGYALTGGFRERNIPAPAHMRYLPLVLK